MTRREAVGPWAKHDMDTAAINKNKVSRLMAELSMGGVSQECRELLCA